MHVLPDHIGVNLWCCAGPVSLFKLKAFCSYPSVLGSLLLRPLPGLYFCMKTIYYLTPNSFTPPPPAPLPPYPPSSHSSYLAFRSEHPADSHVKDECRGEREMEEEREERELIHSLVQSFFVKLCGRTEKKITEREIRMTQIYMTLYSSFKSFLT